MERFMNIKNFFELAKVFEKMKCNLRHSWTSSGRQESVAEHCWRTAMLTYLVKDEFQDVDMNKVIAMCLWHDIGEAITGDIPTYAKTNIDRNNEMSIVNTLINQIPEPLSIEIHELFSEMLNMDTAESKIFKALDNIETIIQHAEADLKTWLPIEYSAILQYGDDKVAFSTYLTQLKNVINDIIKEKIGGDV